MKKKIAILFLLIGLLGFPIIGQAKEIKDNKNLISFTEGKTVRKELQYDPEDEENEEYVYHKMVTLPEIGDRVVHATSDHLVTIVDQRWLNVTDNKVMNVGDKFEENKFYIYSVYYRVDPSETRYVSIIDYDEDYPYSFGFGMGDGIYYDDVYLDQVLIYTGERTEEINGFKPTYASVPILTPQLGKTAPTAPNSELYTITSEKWVNKTDKKDMKSTDVFKKNKLYEYQVTFTTKYYAGYENDIQEPDPSNNYVGGLFESAGEPFTYTTREAFYFGDSSSLVIENGAIVINNTTPPVAGGTLVYPEVQFGDHIDQDRVFMYWMKEEGHYSKELEEGYQVQAGDRINFHMSISPELGYHFAEDFDLVDNNTNDNFLGGSFYSYDGSFGSYYSNYQILESGATIGIRKDMYSPLYPGAGRYLSVYPENADNDSEKITWSSSNPSVATISKYGLVEGKTPGTTVITATNAKGAKATLTIEVGIPVESISVPKSITLYEDESKELEVTINPSNATETGVSISSSDYDVATGYSYNGKTEIHGYKEGQATLTLYSQYDYTTSTTMTVNVIKRPAATEVTLNKTSLTLLTGGEEKLVATASPKEADQHFVWISSDPTVATVNRVGKVTGIKAGTATITAQTENGKKATCKVTVSRNSLEVTSINFNKSNMELEIGAKEQLTVTYTPSNALNQSVTWKSSDKTIATVDSNGNVKGIKEGEATITATTSNGVETTCKVTVVKGTLRIAYSTHVEAYGWLDYVYNGALSGTEGEGKRLEAVKIKLENQDYTGNVLYRTHIQDYGWEKSFKKNNDMSGTSGQGKQLEAIEVKLDGKMAEHYDVYYRVHAANFGWLGWAKNGEAAGTAGYGYRLEAIEVILYPKNKAFAEYGKADPFKDKNEVQSVTLDKTKLSLEAGEETTLVATINPSTATNQSITWTSSNEETATVVNGKVTTHHEGTTTITATSANGKKATCDVNVLPPIPGVAYTTHVQNIGWQEYVRNGTMAGTEGKALRLEGIKVKLVNMDYTGSILYRTHIQNIGWEAKFKKNNEMSGTSGQALRLEAIEIKLDGEVSKHYDVYYRVHAENFGWLGWAKNGESAGTAGYAYRLEGIEIVLEEKGQNHEGYGQQEAFKDKNAPTSITLNKDNLSLYEEEEATLVATILPDNATDKTIIWTSNNEEVATVVNGKVTAHQIGKATIFAKTANGKSASCQVSVVPPTPGVTYTTHVQNIGWQEYVRNGVMAGTSGQSLRLEGIKAKLINMDYEGSILYRTHIQNIGWEEKFKKDDEMSGTSGQALRLEAIEMKLDGEVEKHYDLYYRVHAENFGWLNWAKNGEQAGTAGYAYRLEGIEVVLVEKGAQPPKRDNQNQSKAFYQK